MPTEDCLPLFSRQTISLWDMQPFATENLVHIVARLGYVKETAVHHRERGNWPDVDRGKTQGLLRELLPCLDNLGLTGTRVLWQQLECDLGHLGIEGILSKADAVRSAIEGELKTRKFFVLRSENVGLYNNSTNAGEGFKLNFPNGNFELIEAGNCLALERPTACVCHAMRALEYALRAFEASLGIKPPNDGYGRGNTWGDILRRLEIKRGSPGMNQKGKPSIPKINPSPKWKKNQEFYDDCFTFLSSVKNSCRDKTFHVHSAYQPEAALDLFRVTVVFLKRVAQQLKEI